MKGGLVASVVPLPDSTPDGSETVPEPEMAVGRG